MLRNYASKNGMLEALVTVASVALPALRSDVRHKQEIAHAQRLHAAGAAHARHLLDSRLQSKAAIFSHESVLATRRHALGMEVARSLSRREALRDAWQQRVVFLQTLLLTVVLMLLALFVALTQGRIADIARAQFRTAVGVIVAVTGADGGVVSSDGVSLSQRFGVHLWMGSMGISTASLFVSLWLCLLVQRRIGRYRVLPSLADAGSHGAAIARATIPKSVAGADADATVAASLRPQKKDDDDFLLQHELFSMKDDAVSAAGAQTPGSRAGAKMQPIAAGGDDEDVMSVARQTNRQRHVAAVPTFRGGRDEPEDYASAAAAGADIDEAIDAELQGLVGTLMEPAAPPIVDPAAVNNKQHLASTSPGKRAAAAAEGRASASSRLSVSGAAAAQLENSCNDDADEDGKESAEDEDEEENEQDDFSSRRGGRHTVSSAAAVATSAASGSPEVAPLSATTTTNTAIVSPAVRGGQQQPGGFSSPVDSNNGDAGQSQIKKKRKKKKKEEKKVVVQLRDLDAAEIARHLKNRGPTALANEEADRVAAEGRRSDSENEDADDEDDGQERGGVAMHSSQQHHRKQHDEPQRQEFRYSCGSAHQGFNSYYDCHCEPLRRAAALLLMVGTIAAVLAAASLHAMLMQDVFQHMSSAYFVLALTALAVLVGAVASWMFPDDLLDHSLNDDFMGLGAATANAVAPF